jgi:multidrug efflux system membrane fusion protein
MDIPVWIEALGTVAPAASVTVKPQVSGVLQQVLYKEGQVVHKGEPLATIDARPFEIALMQAQGQRQRDEAQLDNARLTLERYRTLLKQDSIARQDVDTQAALVKQLEGTLLVDKAAEGSARLNLGYTRITAPVAGRVGLRTVDPGNLVSTSDANGVATITQMTPIDVAFAIPQERVPEVQQRVAAGSAMPVTALDRTRSQTLAEGRFLTIDNQIDPQTGTVKAKARFTNEQAKLFPNQFVNVRLLLNEVKGAVTVPISAVRTGPNGDYVFVLQPDHTVEQRPVQRGIATTDRVQIASGVKLGETVVTEGADRLRDGGRVMLPGDRPASGAAGGWGGGGGRHGRGGASGAASGAAWGGPGGGAGWTGGNGASWPHRGASGPWGGASGGGWRHRGEGASGNSGAGNPAAGQ